MIYKWNLLFFNEFIKVESCNPKLEVMYALCSMLYFK